MRIAFMDDLPHPSPNPCAPPASGRLALRHDGRGKSRIVRTSPGVERSVRDPGPTDEVMRDYYRLRASERTAG